MLTCYWQSFQNNSIWLPNVSGSLANGEMCYDNATRIDQKRPHQWFLDNSEQELFMNKKQAIESVKEISGPAAMDGLWRNGSISQSEGQIGDRLFCSKPIRSSNVSGKTVPSFISASMGMEKKGIENQIGNDAAICLTLEDPLSLNTGIRKVKVNEVRLPENCLPEFAGNTFFPGEQNKLMSTAFQRSGNNMFCGPTYNAADGNNISIGPGFSKTERDFISVGQPSSKSDGNFMLSNQYYNGMDMLSIGQAFNRGNYSINTLGGQYEKENDNFVALGPTYGNKGHDNFFAADPFCNRVDETFMSAGSTYNNGESGIAISGRQDAAVVSLGALYNKENSGILSMVAKSKKGEQTTISFGGFQDNHEERDHSGGLISGYDLLLNQSTSQSTVLLGQKDSAEQLSTNVIAAGTKRADSALKNKEQKTKKGSTNNFPSNVKSLLSTGILDGVPVKYVSWSREVISDNLCFSILFNPFNPDQGTFCFQNRA